MRELSHGARTYREEKEKEKEKDQESQIKLINRKRIRLYFIEE